MTSKEVAFAIALCLRMMFSENRHPPRIAFGASFFDIMR